MKPCDRTPATCALETCRESGHCFQRVCYPAKTRWYDRPPPPWAHRAASIVCYVVGGVGLARGHWITLIFLPVGIWHGMNARIAAQKRIHSR